MPIARLFLLALIVGPAKSSPISARDVRKYSEVKAKYEKTIDQCGSEGHVGAIVHLHTSQTIDGLHASEAMHGHAFKQHVLARGHAEDNVKFVYEHTLSGIAGKFSEATMDYLFSHPGVMHVEADCMVTLDDPTVDGDGVEFEMDSSAIAEVSLMNRLPHSVRSKIQYQPQQWGLDRADDRQLPLDSSYDSYGLTGKGTNIYLLDTGVRTDHVDFGTRAVPGWSAGCPGATATSGYCDGTLWVSKGVISEDTKACNYHGTHCASSAAGTSYGMAKEAEIIAVQVLSCSGSGSFSGIVGGIDWSVGDAKQRGHPAVISMSLGGQGSWSVLTNSIDSATAQGVVVSVAAGNSNSDACGFAPAYVASAVTVMAADRYDELAGFTNYGACADLAAPGVSILGAGTSSSTSAITLSGTSMACPHVTGVIAQIRGAYPTLTAQEAIDALMCLTTTGVLTDSAGKLATSPNKNMYIGSDSGTCLPTGGSDPLPPSAPSPLAPSPTPPPVIAPPTTLDGFTYLGCYKDDGGRDLKDGPGGSGGPFTPSICNEECAGYKYFGLQYGGYDCWCGDSYSTPSSQYPAIDEASCTRGGGFPEKYGGPWANSIFMVGTNDAAPACPTSCFTSSGKWQGKVSPGTCRAEKATCGACAGCTCRDFCYKSKSSWEKKCAAEEGLCSTCEECTTRGKVTTSSPESDTPPSDDEHECTDANGNAIPGCMMPEMARKKSTKKGMLLPGR